MSTFSAVDVDPRNYHLMYGFFEGADRYYLWDCGAASAEDALRDGVGELLGSFDDRAEAARVMHDIGGGTELNRGEQRTFLILSHAPGKPWAEDKSGTADPHTVQRT